MNLLILKGYNNYFNRKVKILTSTDAYKSAVQETGKTNYLDLKNYNFNPNDEIYTKLIIGKGDLGDWNNASKVNKGMPDYLVAYTTENSTEVIQSR